MVHIFVRLFFSLNVINSRYLPQTFFYLTLSPYLSWSLPNSCYHSPSLMISPKRHERKYSNIRGMLIIGRRRNSHHLTPTVTVSPQLSPSQRNSHHLTQTLTISSQLSPSHHITQTLTISLQLSLPHPNSHHLTTSPKLSPSHPNSHHLTPTLTTSP